MATHKEIRQRKAAALNITFDLIRRSSNEVKLNDLYTTLGVTVWNTPAYFIQDAMKAAPADIKIRAGRKAGTFAICTNAQTEVKVLIMGGLFPKTYEGKRNDLIDPSTWKLVTKLPKMFAKRALETLALFRLDREDKPSQYLQVTNEGNWLFELVA